MFPKGDVVQVYGMSTRVPGYIRPRPSVEIKEEQVSELGVTRRQTRNLHSLSEEGLPEQTSKIVQTKRGSDRVSIEEGHVV